MKCWLAVMLIAGGWGVAALPVPMPREFFFADTLSVDLTRPIGYEGGGAKLPAKLLAEELSRWCGREIQVMPGAGAFRLVVDRTLAPGAYAIEGETLSGGDEAGLLAAVQTVLGALAGPDAEWAEQTVTLPVLMIQDSPAVGWRAARMEGLEQEINGVRALARLKYNVLLLRHIDLELIAQAQAFGLAVVPEVGNWEQAQAWVDGAYPIREMYFSGTMAAEMPRIREFCQRYQLEPLVGMEGASDPGMVTLVYEGDGDRRRFPELEQLRREGKRIVFAPRTPEDARLMAQNAALYGYGVIAPAWDASSAIADTMVVLAEYAWNPRSTRIPYPFPTLSVWYDLLRDRPTRTGGSVVPVELPVAAGEGNIEVCYKGMLFRVTEPLLLGAWPDGDFDGALENVLAQAAPLTVWRNGIEVATAPMINEAPDFDGWNLYTRNYGVSTGTGVDYGEVQVVNGVVTQVKAPGVGDMRIPHCGAVLTRRDWTPDWQIGDTVSFTGQHGDTVELYSRAAMAEYPESAEIELTPELFSRLHFWHDTGVEAEAGAVVEAELYYTDGTLTSFALSSPAMLGSADGAEYAAEAWVAATDGAEHNADTVAYAYSWQNPHPEKLPRLLRLRITDAGRRCGYRLWALSREQ